MTHPGAIRTGALACHVLALHRRAEDGLGRVSVRTAELPDLGTGFDDQVRRRPPARPHHAGPAR